MSVKILCNGHVEVAYSVGRYALANQSDPFDILHWMNMPVELEDGITVNQLLRCLKPWASVIARTSEMEYDAWVKSAARPLLSLVDDDFDDDDDENIQLVVVQPFISFVERKNGGGYDVKMKWDVWGIPKDSFYESGGDYEKISLSFLHPSKYSNVPIVIETNTDVLFIQKYPRTVPLVTIEPTLYNSIMMGLLHEISACGRQDDAIEEESFLETAVSEE